MAGAADEDPLRFPVAPENPLLSTVRLPAPGMKRQYILFASNTTGFRVGSIVHGALRECHRLNIGLLWREYERWDLDAMPDRPLGIIAWGKLSHIERLVQQAGSRVPVVSTIGHTLELPIVTVVPDPVDIARQVATHLISEGLRKFVYVGSRKNPASRMRAKAFEAELARHDVAASFRFFDVELEDRFWGADAASGQAFIDLLRAETMPVGVFAFNDQTAASCLECAESAGIRVPQEMSIVGVDDHPIFARMYLPLSTVKIDYVEIGREAVRQLFQVQQKRRKSPADWQHFVSGQLVVRESSRPRLLGDTQISRTLHFLHENFMRPVTLVELARLAGMSRASFAARFQRAVGQSPIRYVIKLRLEEAKLLLSESLLTVSEIAFRVGFEDQGYFTRAFKKHFDTTPTDFRRIKMSERLQRR